MSPEQCEGRAVDHRADIYALGVLLYEMVAARVPHDADTAMAILHKHVYERPTPIDLYVPDVRSSVKRIIGRCLEKKPERRYQSMHELRADLERLPLHEDEGLVGAMSAWRDLAPSRRGLKRLALAMAAVASLGALAVGAFSKAGDPTAASSEPTERTVVETERGVPDALALPEERVASRGFDSFAPPASLVRPVEPALRKAPRRARRPAQKTPNNRHRPRLAEPVAGRVSQDDVLDPWM
jgi:hypothetical protein